MTEEAFLRDHGLWRRPHQEVDDPEWTVDHGGVHTGVGKYQKHGGPQRKPHCVGGVPKRMLDRRGAHTGSGLPLRDHGPMRSPCWYKGNK